MAGAEFPREFPRRGEIYEVNFDPARGSEQAGKRPAVVISNDVMNQHGSVVIVAAVTSSQPEKRGRYPTAVFLPAGELPKDSAVLCNQVLTITKDRLEAYRGALDETQMVGLKRALACAFALPRP